MKQIKALEELLTQAASEYSYEAGDLDFTCMVIVTCEDGWAKASVIDNEEGGEA